MMKIYCGSAIIISFVGLILIWAWKLLNWAWLKPKKLEKQLREQGLNGNSYRPLYGDLKDNFKMRDEAREKPIPFTNDYITRVLPFLHQHVAKYGQNCFTWLGPVPTINITQPELIREVFTRINEFQKARTNPLIRLLVPGLVSLEGEKWAMHRKLINPAFHMEKLKLMLPAFRASVTELTDKWENSMSETGSSELDVWPDITNLTADVISRAAFGSSFEEGRRIFELLKEQTQMTIRLFQSFYIPGWKYVPTKNNRQMKKINEDIQGLLKGIIDKRKKAMDAGEAAKNDLLGILMESNIKETRLSQSHGNNKRLLMSFRDMIDECKLFYFAGQETTSVLLVWTMILLSKHQDWQMKAREEILSVFGQNLPDVDGVNHLKSVTMILYEVLRLYPPLLAVSRRIYDQDTMLCNNLCVPEGAMVSLSIYQVHHDPKLWGDDVNEFKPDRFSEGILKATKGNLSFFPFIGGPRICIGQNFALVEAKIALAMLLQRFSFELSPSYTHAPTTSVTLQPQYGAHLIVRRL
ncbi:cytochrome P450 72A397-like [Silene latifolia]|uniref:cytochrome P450 72A397-like n=1 Tax=Silene latifolia TaxID=37657 RepID=UPI003D76BB9B